MSDDILKQLGEPGDESAPKDEGKKAPRARKAKKAAQVVAHGRAYILATYNNTIINFTDTNGNTVTWSSAGKMGFKGPKRSTPYAATVIVKDAANRVRDAHGMREVDVFIKGIGPGRESAIRTLVGAGFEVMSIKDVTPVPHNGCRPKGRRRI